MSDKQLIFGPFTLLPDDTRLFRDGVEIRLRPQAVKALTALAVHPGRFVGYDRMIAEAWGGIVVSRHTVDVTIGEVRRSLGEYGQWIGHRPKIGYCLTIPRADALINRGYLFWSLRTRDGFERALDCFSEAAAEDATDFRAFEGQSICYLMLASQGMRPPREMYPRFLEAHRRAVAIAGVTPELRCNLAHGLHMFEHRLGEAEREFDAVLRADPTLASAHVRLAMLYATLGRLDDALRSVERAREVAPLVPLVSAIQVCVRYWRREFDVAVAAGAEAVALHPFLQLGRAFYAQALEFSDRFDDALEQYRISLVMSPGLSWMRALEGACLARIGRVDEASAIADELDKRRSQEYIDAYGVALIHDALDNPGRADAELERAFAENSAGLYLFPVDPKADRLRERNSFKDPIRWRYSPVDQV